MLYSISISFERHATLPEPLAGIGNPNACAPMLSIDATAQTPEASVITCTGCSVGDVNAI